jgi:hypothetical protein
VRCGIRQARRLVPLARPGTDRFVARAARNPSALDFSAVMSCPVLRSITYKNPFFGAFHHCLAVDVVPRVDSAGLVICPTWRAFPHRQPF